MANVKNYNAYENALKKFCKIAGRENAAKWALKKFFATIDVILQNNCYNCTLIEDIRKSLDRKVRVKARYIKLPKWERLVNRAKTELKKYKIWENEGTLNGNVETIDTIPAKKGMQEIEINIKDEPEYHSPHVHIVYGKQEATFLLSKPNEIFEGDDLGPKVIKVVAKRIKQNLDFYLNKYNEKNPTHWKK